MLIRLRGCAGWSAALLFSYGIRQVFAWPGPLQLSVLDLEGPPIIAQRTKNPDSRFQTTKLWANCLLHYQDRQSLESSFNTMGQKYIPIPFVPQGLFCIIELKQITIKQVSFITFYLRHGLNKKPLFYVAIMFSGPESLKSSFLSRQLMSRLMTKPTKWLLRPAKTLISLGIRPVWSEFSLWALWVAKDPSFLHADNEDSDQTRQMPKLIWVFAGRTCHLVGFVMRRLKLTLD